MEVASLTAGYVSKKAGLLNLSLRKLLAVFILETYQKHCRSKQVAEVSVAKADLRFQTLL